jgi:hypothetical protein
MVGIDSRRPFFPLSNQCVTLRSQLRLVLQFLRTMRTTSVDLLGSLKPGYSGLWLLGISQEALDYVRS